MKPGFKKIIKNYGIIVIASFIYAIAFDMFFDPNGISMGGITGIAQILNRLLPFLPIGAMVVVFNIPLFILGVKYQGFHILWSSLFAMVISSIFMDLIPKFITFNPMEDLLVASIFGGAILGFSMGLMLWVGATTGGTELAASLLKRKFAHIQIGRICLIIDVIVIVIYAAAFKDLSSALYAGIAMFISTSAMDAVIYGRRNSKVAVIVCKNGEKILEKLIGLNFGITLIKAKGGYSMDDKHVLVSAFKLNRIAAIKNTVSELDKDAFVIISDAKEIFGEGFMEYDINAL